MTNIETIAKIANEKLGKQVFEINGFGILVNEINRYKGNDINMTEEADVFYLSVTGDTEEYETIEDAVQGLIDTYTPEEFIVVTRWSVGYNVSEEFEFNTLESAQEKFDELRHEFCYNQGGVYIVTILDSKGREIKEDCQVSALLPEGGVIVTFKHHRYMNYAYEILAVENVRSGQRYEDLSDNPDTTTRVWQTVYDSKEELYIDFENRRGIFAKIHSGQSFIEEYLGYNYYEEE